MTQCESTFTEEHFTLRLRALTKEAIIISEYHKTNLIKQSMKMAVIRIGTAGKVNLSSYIGDKLPKPLSRR